MNKIQPIVSFRYIIELNVPIRPRNLAYDIAIAGYDKYLISVTDLQFNTHVYGDIYPYRARKRAAARTERQLQKVSPWKQLGKEFIRQLKLFL